MPIEWPVRWVKYWPKPEATVNLTMALAGVAETVTVTSERALNRAQLFEVFLSTLRANGLVVTPTSSGAYRISPAQGAALGSPFQSLPAVSW